MNIKENRQIISKIIDRESQIGRETGFTIYLILALGFSSIYTLLENTIVSITIDNFFVIIWISNFCLLLLIYFANNFLEPFNKKIVLNRLQSVRLKYISKGVINASIFYIVIIISMVLFFNVKLIAFTKDSIQIPIIISAFIFMILNGFKARFSIEISFFRLLFFPIVIFFLIFIRSFINDSFTFSQLIIFFTSVITLFIIIILWSWIEITYGKGTSFSDIEEIEILRFSDIIDYSYKKKRITYFLLSLLVFLIFYPFIIDSKDFFSSMNKNVILIGLALFGFFITIILAYDKIGHYHSKRELHRIEKLIYSTDEENINKIKDFVNEYINGISFEYWLKKSLEQVKLNVEEIEKELISFEENYAKEWNDIVEKYQKDGKLKLFISDLILGYNSNNLYRVLKSIKEIEKLESNFQSKYLKEEFEEMKYWKVKIPILIKLENDLLTNFKTYQEKNPR